MYNERNNLIAETLLNTNVDRTLNLEMARRTYKNFANDTNFINVMTTRGEKPIPTLLEVANLDEDDIRREATESEL